MFTWAIIDDARDRHTAPGIARRSRLASGPGGLQQNVNLFLREPLVPPRPAFEGSADHTQLCRKTQTSRNFFRDGTSKPAVRERCARYSAQTASLGRHEGPAGAT